MDDSIDRLKTIKNELARLANSRNARCTAWKQDCPTEWHPTKVIDPRTKEPFTNPGAWDFVVEMLLKPETVLEEKELDKPRGKKGYELKIKTESGVIYIKLQFGLKGGTIIGRSFHYSFKDTIYGAKERK